jgi:hypothetical protein
MNGSYSSMDDALEILSAYGPDLQNGMTSHAPMAAEALCAMGRPEAVLPWVETYRKGMLPRVAPGERIERSAWRGALGRMDRAAAWVAFFAEELREAPWRRVVNRWTGLLAPGICAAATHGVIRVGHAARSLAEAESALRLGELAEALGYWAATYEELPGRPPGEDLGMSPRRAIERVAVVPLERRRFEGSIVSSLAALPDFPEFAPVIGFIGVAGDPAGLIAELTEVFARVYLANVHDVLTSIVFVHGVTGVAALGNLLPALDDDSARTALRYAWQSSCALYATFGSRPKPAREVEPPRDDPETLVERAVAHGDEHVIKFTEACLRQHALRPSPAYVAAVSNALETLPAPGQ